MLGCEVSRGRSRWEPHLRWEDWEQRASWSAGSAVMPGTHLLLALWQEVLPWAGWVPGPAAQAAQ